MGGCGRGLQLGVWGSAVSSWAPPAFVEGGGGGGGGQRYVEGVRGCYVEGVGG